MDVALKWTGLNFDLSLFQNDLTLDGGLDTAIAISLFSDIQIDKSELDINETDRRGWWADQFADDAADQIGSRLWTLQRSKQTDETLRKAQQYCQDALQWFIDDGVADSVDVVTEYESTGFMGIQVTVTSPTGQQSFKFKTAWTAQASA